MDLRERALKIDDILVKTYGGPFIPFSYRDPLSELINSLLSHRTKNAVTRAAFQRLTTTFPTWEEVIAAPTAKIEAAIAAVTFPEVKAPRIQSALAWVRERRDGELSLDFLGELPVREARDWLEQIPGVGPKTGAAVLSFSRLRMPALVVDTHHQRVAQRIGLVPPKASLDKCARQLQAYLPAEWDGQRVCHWRSPECGRCPVSELCDYAVSSRPATDTL
jgi:endonuclease-3